MDLTIIELAMVTPANNCDGTGRALPHSNNAARADRSSSEALQHYFGVPSVWLTVTPDESTSYIVQIFAGIKVEKETDVARM